MTKNVRIYHNPRCTKSRQALQLLEEKNITPDVVLYLQTPPEKQTLINLAKMLGLSARGIMRTKEDIYKEHNLGDTSLSEDDLFQAIVENPILLERPIVISDNKAAIGRPTENILGIL